MDFTTIAYLPHAALHAIIPLAFSKQFDTKNSCLCQRKTKAMMDGGAIDPRNLHFTNPSPIKVNALMEKKYHRLNSLIDRQCQRLFREQPVFDSPDFVKSFRKMLNSDEFKEIFNLQN